MGRPLGKGLDFFFMGVDFHDDERLHLVFAKHGAVGEKVITRLMCKLYRVGYCYKWDERDQIIFAAKIGESVSVVREVVSDALNEGFFSRNVYDRCRILTSEETQRTFEHASKKRSLVEFRSDLLLITPKNSNVRVTSPETPISGPESSEKGAETIVSGGGEAESIELFPEETPYKRVEERREEESIPPPVSGSENSKNQNHQERNFGNLAIDEISENQFRAAHGDAVFKRAVEVANADIEKSRGTPDFERKRRQALNGGAFIRGWPLVRAIEDVAAIQRSANRGKPPPPPEARKLSFKTFSPTEAIDAVRKAVDQHFDDEAAGLQSLPETIAEAVKRIGWSRFTTTEVAAQSEAERQLISTVISVQRRKAELELGGAK